ncbi:hypothetical protein QWY93_02555 [Echinicola jeungdonensis]|uniref:Tellurite resistance protein TerB n=1 Tax=Echinicola jeungdonensis TaxID=709343 RepID=A0ABV5J3N3_9BACT|nr:hypothetical protein [Echinicola jeungdonensis]MDN3668210.1 hypothetical protein [Echinicola jeungdonensis]
MQKEFEKLSQQDRELLLKAPVLVSLLAASTDGAFDEEEKADAIELAHFRTFTAIPELQPFYREVEKIIKSQWEQLTQQYSPLDEMNHQALGQEVEEVNKVILKLDEDYARWLTKSLKSYAKHVSEIHRNFFEFFVFPPNVPGITD